MSRNKVRRTVRLVNLLHVRELIPLDENLMDELVKKGWTRQRLEDAKQLGFQYSEKRGSLIKRSELEDFFDPDVMDSIPTAGFK